MYTYFNISILFLRLEDVCIQARSRRYVVSARRPLGLSLPYPTNISITERRHRKRDSALFICYENK